MPTAKKNSATRDDIVHRAKTIFKKLKRKYPQAHCALDHVDAWQLIAATILSAQCTDERVNMVTPTLFKEYPNPKAMSTAQQTDVEKIIHSTGFYRQKAKSLIATGKGITENFGGEVPHTMQELLTLRGVARKTANVVLGNAYGINEGVVVDTHVKRLANRMGLTTQTDPVKVEKDMVGLFPRKDWTLLSHLLIWHGRNTCGVRKPQCEQCVLANDCPKVGVT